ncbi:MAG: amidinotransferase [Planctomycetes bacterium]|nr:amidinotransferase [Planctomycetota bacterium]
MNLPVVNSFNDWDPLEEVIVGIVDGAACPAHEVAAEAVVKDANFEAYGLQARKFAGRPRPNAELESAKKDLAEFVHMLQAEGVVVRRPDPVDNARPYTTPDGTFPGGTGQTCPRDTLVVVGNEIIEASMSWRGRYFEAFAYRSLLKEYFHQGARWVAAPKSQMLTELYDYGARSKNGWVTTEFEPVWDAADITRCGRDLFVQRSHATNESGIEWIRRHLGDAYRVHRVEFTDPRALHTFRIPSRRSPKAGRPARSIVTRRACSRTSRFSGTTISVPSSPIGKPGPATWGTSTAKSTAAR